MTVFHQIKTANNWAIEQRLAGHRIGLVPTMGALHEGHLSLVRQARKSADMVAASIFVNPTQFGPNEDLDRYPRTLERDLALLEREGVDAVFAPSAREMYPDGFSTYVSVEGLSSILEGAIRPTHFRGVATVVQKLFHILEPHTAVFGQKDYQQLLVIRQMVRDLDMPIGILAHPTVREADGMALSSRNAYLDANQRQAGIGLSRALRAVQEAASTGAVNPSDLEKTAQNVLSQTPGLVPEYAVVRDSATLGDLDLDWKSAVCLVAARAGTTRLIDNVVFGRQGQEVFA